MVTLAPPRNPWLVMLVATQLLATSTWSDDVPPRDRAKSSNSAKTPLEPGLKRHLYKGQVVKAFDALKKQGVKAYADELKGQVVLQTTDGELIPILPDWRGRAFFQDERLRDRDVELVGFRRTGIPYLSVMSVYTFDENGNRQYTDYWCDICSIPMYEIKPCDCCQQEIRLRFQRQEVSELEVGKSESVPKSH